MDYVNLGNQGVKVSRLCLGTMMFGGPTDAAESIRITHRALDEGINFIDTANVYNHGESERITGKAIAGRRDQVVLATKVRGPAGQGPNGQGASRLHIAQEVENSLERLDTDYIDIYLVHSPDYDTPLEESLQALDNLVRQGKIRYYGLSNYYAWQVCQAQWLADRRHLSGVACVQSLYNVFNRDPEVELWPCCRQLGIGTMVYSPLARGVLTGKYLPGSSPPEGSRAARGDARIKVTELREESFELAQKLAGLADQCGVGLADFALNWVLANPIITSAIIGPRTMEQYESSWAALGWEMSAEIQAQVDGLVPPGEHTGWGFNDPKYPVLGRPQA
ncbi:MAG: aldo/keto reductase [Candidatus Latescibacteria bacterium]|nr:aldo/keto reductase [Candidatus Latescibacterota bacterium]